MTDAETILKQQRTIERLTRKVKRLENRLIEKKSFEREDLIQRGATPQFIDKIDRKDREALED